MPPNPRELKNLVFFQKGKPPAQQPYFGSDAELYLTPEYLRGREASEPVKASSNAVRVSDGDTIVLWDGSNAGEVFRARRGVLASTMALLRLSESFDRGYFFYAMKNLEPLLKSQTAGSGIPHVDKEVLSRLTVFEFPKKEQLKIAEVLLAFDIAIEQTEAILAKQQRVKTGLMQDVLTRGIDEHGAIRAEQTHAFKESPLGRIPREWDVKKCAALCKRIEVGIVVRPVQYYKPEGVKVLRSANVRENGIDPSNLVYMSDRDNEILSKSQLRAGDLVTVRTGYPGTTAVITPEFHGSNCVDLIISRPDIDEVRSEFLSIWINSNYGKSQILEGQGGLAQQHFNVGAMKLLLVKVPHLPEQQRVEELLSRQDVSIAHIRQGLSKLRHLRTALMHDVLTGGKSVTPLLGSSFDREPAYA